MATSRIDRAQQLLDEAVEQSGAVRIPCSACGETVGYYRPGRVVEPSRQRPRVRMKCTRRGCRTETLVTLDEVLV